MEGKPDIEFSVVDPRLSAGRGIQFSAGGLTAFDAEEKVGEDGVAIDNGGVSEAEIASIHTPIGEENVGFKLLQKMGWKEGAGLGRNEDGIVVPVKPYQEGGENTRMGLGKIEQDEEYTSADRVSRKRLEVEIQADEDVERVKRREDQVTREKRIKEDVQAAKQKFFCQICHKQYQTIMEWDGHLSSYDHHHKKRLSEMKAMVSGRSKRDRLKREQKQLSKEMAHLAEQSERARQQESEPVPHPKKSLSSNTQTDLPLQRTAIQFGFGETVSNKPLTAGSKRPHQSNDPRSIKSSKHTSGQLAAFGSDSEEDCD